MVGWKRRIGRLRRCAAPIKVHDRVRPRSLQSSKIDAAVVVAAQSYVGRIDPRWPRDDHAVGGGGRQGGVESKRRRLAEPPDAPLVEVLDNGGSNAGVELNEIAEPGDRSAQVVEL